MTDARWPEVATNARQLGEPFVLLEDSERFRTRMDDQAIALIDAVVGCAHGGRLAYYGYGAVLNKDGKPSARTQALFVHLRRSQVPRRVRDACLAHYNGGTA